MLVYQWIKHAEFSRSSRKWKKQRCIIGFSLYSIERATSMVGIDYSVNTNYFTYILHAGVIIFVVVSGREGAWPLSFSPCLSSLHH